MKESTIGKRVGQIGRIGENSIVGGSMRRLYDLAVAQKEGKVPGVGQHGLRWNRLGGREVGHRGR
jgi:hypothetical protein